MGPFGMLYLVQPANVYAALTNIPYYPPLLPADQPQTTPVMLPTEVTRVTTKWYITRQQYYNHKNANQALIAFFRKAFDADILTEIASDMAAKTETKLIPVFERFLAKYGQPDSQDEDKNNVRMKQLWDLAHKDFTMADFGQCTRKTIDLQDLTNQMISYFVMYSVLKKS
jgi:hypothetical protein